MNVLYEFSKKKIMKKCMMAATFVCGTTMALSSCSSKDDAPPSYRT